MPSTLNEFLDKALNETKKLNEEERWEKNFIVPANDKRVLMVNVIAAEANGWRVEVGYSFGGKVIEHPKQSLSSDWVGTFEEAEKLAKSKAKIHKIKWKKKPYGSR